MIPGHAVINNENELMDKEECSKDAKPEMERKKE